MPDTTGDELELLTTSQVAAILKLHRETVKQWCVSGRLPAFKVGKAWRVRRSELQKWIEQQGKEAQ